MSRITGASIGNGEVGANERAVVNVCGRGNIGAVIAFKGGRCGWASGEAWVV